MCFRKQLAEWFFYCFLSKACNSDGTIALAGGMLTQAEEGMKLFEAQQGTAAEVGILIS